MQTLVARYSTRADLRGALLADNPSGGLFVATEEELRLGQEVRVLALVPEVPDRKSVV